MAAYSGDFYVKFDVSKLTEDELKQLDDFLADWRGRYSTDEVIMNWLFEFGKPDYEIQDYSNWFDTVMDSERLMEQAAEKFPKLNGHGNSCLCFLGAGGPNQHVEFSFANGKLDWKEEYDEEDGYYEEF